MSGQRFEQSIVDGSRNCTRKASPSLRCRSCRKSLIEALRASQFAQITRRMAQRFDRIKRIAETALVGGFRHELCDPFRALAAEVP